MCVGVTGWCSVVLLRTSESEVLPMINPVIITNARLAPGTRARLSRLSPCAFSFLKVKRLEGEMELPLHMLPLCCHSLCSGYFHRLAVLSRLDTAEAEAWCY